MESSFRRRRKRARVVQNNQQRQASQNFDDDSSSAFLDIEGDALSDRKASQVSLPKLLDERRLGLQNQRKIISWQARALLNFTKKPENKKQYRRQWRPYAKRNILFTQLGTPIADAVLALERKASYVLCLGSKQDDSDVPLSLALRFYGVPSPHRERTTPLLSVVPLLYESHLGESAEDLIFNFRRNVSPDSTPVKILISNDWKVGCCMFQPSNVWREEGPVGTLVLFSLPQNNDFGEETKVYRCINVRIAKNRHLRNLLWRVDKIPLRTQDLKNSIFDFVLEVSGYLLVNDEEDGFRLTWVLDSQWNLQANCKTKILTSTIQSESEEPIISIQDTWEESYSNIRDGRHILHDDNVKVSGVTLSSEAFLHVDILLREIINRRKGMSLDTHPEYFYNLVSVTERGRTAEIVITFLRKGKVGSLGVFVKVDLFTGRFQELDWVKSLGAKDSSALRTWCNSLALNRRMRQMRVGPFSTEIREKLSKDWSVLCHETYFDLDQEDDYQKDYWSDYVCDAKSISTRKPPKFISLSSLYPDCDFVSNEALIECLPVPSLQCKDSPVQIVYG